MSCDKYNIFESGEMNKKDFLLHLETCPECKKIYQQDELLIQAAKDLNKQVVVPDLWPGIEETLRKESKRTEFKLVQFVNDHKFTILRFAAILLITILAGLYMLSQPGPETIDQSRILDQAALERVNEKEQEYLAAIEHLEKTASQKLASIDANLMNLYENKLRIIDQQITRCQEALEQNPANTHIRKYLFAVLQDKKQTLEEIISYHI